MAVSVANARAELASRTLRGVVVFEVQKLRRIDPKSTSWEKDAVGKMLSQRAIDPADLDPYNPDPNGGGNGGSNPDANGGSNPYSRPGSNPGSNGGPTTATATNYRSESTNVLSLNDSARDETGYRRIPIPDDWSPNDIHQARFPDLDLDAEALNFRDHAISEGRVCDRRAGWDAAFSRWCTESKRRSEKADEGKPKHKMRKVAEHAARARRAEGAQHPSTATVPDQRAITG
jgi:hypothetical protein